MRNKKPLVFIQLYIYTLGKHHLLKVHNKSSPNPTLALIGAFVSLMKIFFYLLLIYFDINKLRIKMIVRRVKLFGTIIFAFVVYAGVYEPCCLVCLFNSLDTLQE